MLSVPGALVVASAFAPIGPILLLAGMVALWGSLILLIETRNGVMCAKCGTVVASTNRIYQRDHFFRGEFATCFSHIFSHAIETRDENLPPIRTERGFSVSPHILSFVSPYGCFS